MKTHLLFIPLVFFMIACEKEPVDKFEIPEGFKDVILSDYFVKSIAFEDNGTAWIGTFKQGLIKYETSGKISIYNSENSIFSDSLVFYDIEVDNKNNVWFGSDALYKYNGTNFSKFNSNNSPIPEDYIRDIAIDSKDNIWFSSSRNQLGGLVKYDGTNFTVFTPDNSDLPDHFINSIKTGSDDKVWMTINSGHVGTGNCIANFNGAKWTIIDSATLGFKPYYWGGLEIDSDNRVYGFIDYSLSSLYDPDRQSIFVYDGQSTSFLGTGSMFFLSAAYTVDRDDNLWCRHNRSYAVYSNEQWYQDTTEVFNEGLFTIEQAPDGNMWFGTGQGIYILDNE